LFAIAGENTWFFDLYFEHQSISVNLRHGKNVLPPLKVRQAQTTAALAVVPPLSTVSFLLEVL
jgi:hypothetical protein